MESTIMLSFSCGNKMKKRNKGQVRIIEALLTLMIMLSALSAAVFFGGTRKGGTNSELLEVGENILSILDDQDVIQKIVFTEGDIDSELKTFLEALLPPDVFYSLTISSVEQNQVLSEISNTENQTLLSVLDSTSFQEIRTISMPVGRKEFLNLDIVLTIDRSGSMGWDTPPRISYAKLAAKTFVDQLDESRDEAGLTSFGRYGTLDHPLSNDFVSVKSEIDDLNADGATNMGEGLEEANDEFVAHHRADALMAIIILSDGLVNVDRGGNIYDDEDDRTPAMNYVREEADVAEDMGIIIYTIGLGEESNNFDEDLLKEIVKNGGNYYYAPSAEDLVQIYQKIALDLFYQVQYEIVKIELTLAKAG